MKRLLNKKTEDSFYNPLQASGQATSFNNESVHTCVEGSKEREDFINLQQVRTCTPPCFETSIIGIVNRNYQSRIIQSSLNTLVNAWTNHLEQV
ncbi:hypothetical protein NC653_020277 [Populus alba x Populus x berolinensis]|uniref:Uncharacterized protein n=1 Tax=Populus alba x Populus x berolinensis TaxID=444605 RepID=A0AAD6MK65_9ROSI|nr:hypothetical protein NC653_020277 [Populus alba x Populus x berolinensis]